MLTTAAGVVAAYLCALLANRPEVMREVWSLDRAWYFAPFLVLPLPVVLLTERLQVRRRDGRLAPWRRGWRVVGARFVRDFGHPARVARALAAAGALYLIGNVFSSWKRAIPTLVGFRWDERLAAADRWLHAGRNAWELLPTVVTSPEGLRLLEAAYFTWVPVLGFVAGWQVWSRRSEFRARFFLTAAFVFLALGSVVATLFSSGGPAYYGDLVAGPNPFAPLLNHLSSVPELLTPGAQQALRGAQANASVPLDWGIAAMPSVHVGMVTLYAVLGWHRAWWLGVVFTGYALLTLTATVALGWHYAIDGYASIVAVLAFWALTGRWTARRPRAPRRPAVRLRAPLDGGPPPRYFSGHDGNRIPSGPPRTARDHGRGRDPRRRHVRRPVRPAR